MADTEQIQINKPSPLRESHQDLYGRLLAANARIDEIGTWQIWISTLIALLLCLCIQQGWGSAWLDMDLQAYRSWLMYGTICVVVFIINGQLMDARENIAYDRLKVDLYQAVAKSGLDHGAVLSMISEDEQLEQISAYLQKDREFISDNGMQ